MAKGAAMYLIFQRGMGGEAKPVFALANTGGGSRSPGEPGPAGALPINKKKDHPKAVLKLLIS